MLIDLGFSSLGPNHPIPEWLESMYEEEEDGSRLCGRVYGDVGESQTTMRLTAYIW